MEASSNCFDNHRCQSWSEENNYMWEHGEDGTMCSHTFTLFWLRKTSVIVEMFQLSFHVFIKCAFNQEISSFFGKTFLSLFLLCYSYFGICLSTWSSLWSCDKLFSPFSILNFLLSSLYLVPFLKFLRNCVLLLPANGREIFG